MAAITIYTTPICPYCNRAKDLLKRKGRTDWKEVDVSDDDERTKMIEKAGGRRTVPQIFIGDTHVGGFDDLSALDRKGELDGLLAS
tara:strand:+ start:1417 stop:1674 length:258 start_codon:yes stop_codon:yes gene_type:complete